MFWLCFIAETNRESTDLVDPKQNENDDLADDGKTAMLSFIRSQRGAPFLLQSGFVYRCERRNGFRTYWLCTKYKITKCGGRLICQGNDVVKFTEHNHEADWSRIGRSIIEYQNMNGPHVDDFLNSYKK